MPQSLATSLTTLAVFLAAPALAPALAPVPQDSFDLDDLKAIVAELEPHLPRNPNFVYPIEISLEEQPIVNAFAGCRPVGDKLQSILCFYRGMIDATGQDVRLLRAVAAHELAHLALNHSLENFVNMRDVDNAWTRAEEHAADVMAAQVLEKAGYERQDVVDMLLFLDRDARKAPGRWFSTVTGTHASPVTRAALLDGGGPRYEAVLRFELGLAYMECRRHREALAYFDEAIALEPRLLEAYPNAASAALQSYYEALPDSVLAEWLRPDFGVHLTSTSLLDAKGLTLTDEDRARYAAVLERLAAIPEGAYPVYTAFLEGTTAVLHPDGDETAIRGGVRRLQLLLGTPMPRAHEMGVDRVRWANNAAVGLQRLGDGSGAVRLLAGEQAQDMRYVPAAAANLARLPLTTLSHELQATVVNVLVYHLSRTSTKVAGRAEAEAALDATTKRLNLTVKSEPTPAPVFLCRAARITIGEHDLGLFDPLERFTKALGEPAGLAGVHEKYPQLAVRFWGAADLLLLTEREGAMKITSYRPGTAVELLPADTGSRETFRISVGMTRAALDELLRPAGEGLARKEVMLLGRAFFQGEGGGFETWTYFPALNLGVYFVEDRVAGISVTPVKV